jgi:hypothetical protein
MPNPILDPRWYWLQAALRRLYKELDNEALPASLSIVSSDGEELISYSLAPGSHEIERRIIVSPSALLEAAEITTVDASVE